MRLPRWNAQARAGMGFLLALQAGLWSAGCQDTPSEVTPSSQPTAPLATTAPVSTPTAGVTPGATRTPGTPSPTPAGPTPTTTPADNDLDDDGFTDLEGDCNDLDPTIHPDAHEIPYDGIDQDCAEGDLIDVDQDGFPSTQVEGGSDCNDTSTNTYPGATEFEDDQDNDCDGSVDEALNTTDDDHDGYSEAAGDCDDSNPDRAPGKTDLPYDGIDQDCSGADLTDVDQDGYAGGASGTDCNDSEATIHPEAQEVPYDGIDQDCDETDLVDQDKDGAEGGPEGSDCDDLDPTRSPLLSELPYDGVDQDCSGTDLIDVDTDGQAATQASGTDCNDTNATIYLGALEVPYDGIDQDCSGADLIDVDQDGHASTQAGGDDCDDTSTNTYPGADEFEDDQDNDCDGAIDENLNTNDDDGDGLSESGGDCNDGAAEIHPGATELPYDGIDQDCSGQDLTDVDQDGFSSTQAGGSDCNDQAAQINPSSTEIPYDTVDQDCSGSDLNDVDQDGFVAEVAGGTDCDDTTALVHPGASEVPYDAIDQDCTDTDLVDVDQDGYRATLAGGDDCNDSAAAIHPGAAEVCDTLDNNCDGVVDQDAIDRGIYYVDADGDTYGDPSRPLQTCSPTLNQVSNSADCNDSSALAYPGATEVCDDLDNNCDSTVDEGVKSFYFADLDADDYGDPSSPLEACAAPSGYVEDDTDCDDLEPTTHPGAAEVCNEVDDDCNDQIDEGVLTAYYPDADQDGYGVTHLQVQLCAAPASYVETPGDCDDTQPSVHPGGQEVCDALNLDEDCSGSADDADPGVNPSTKTPWYQDSDGDGYGSASTSTTSCDAPSGTVASAADCNDTSAAIKPGASELAGDSIDQNCDGAETCFADADNDGYRPNATSTTASSDSDCLDANEATSTDPSGDCDDTSAAIRPGVTELAGDSVDQDCDGTETCFQDADDDGYRPDTTSTVASLDTDCADIAEATSSDPTSDCNDTSAAIKPGASELAGDSIDQNCDGIETCYADADNDGYRPNATATTASSDADCLDGNEAISTDPTGDCNDTNAAINPGAVEVPNGVDDNCNTSIDDGITNTSCKALKTSYPSLTDGVYSIDPDGAGGRAAFPVFCDMTTDGGGWTYGAIVRTTTDTVNGTRVPGVTVFGTPTASKLSNEYSQNLSGLTYSEIRIDNFTKGAALRRSLTGTALWDATTYASGYASLPAKRVSLANSYEFRVGYYYNGCGAAGMTIPMCFVPNTNPVSWACDSDSYPIEGWVDAGGGELCGLYYCKKLWRDSTCTSYVSTPATYGFALR